MLGARLVDGDVVLTPLTPLTPPLPLPRGELHGLRQPNWPRPPPLQLPLWLLFALERTQQRLQEWPLLLLILLLAVPKKGRSDHKADEQQLENMC